MEYPLISEYREAIMAAEDNFKELASLRPVFDAHGEPVMSSGNFAVVFKMQDEDNGKLYAVKCFIKDQEGRDESYRKIADELEVVSSAYILPLRYLESELFVDTEHCDEEEFPVVVMEWVEGETLDAYLNSHLDDEYALEMLSYRFNRMAAWLLAQPFAHGDLKPDNILVRKDGSLVLVDYDGMFVPSMKGEKAREIGSPDYRHPLRTDTDFDEHIDDFTIALIALSLKAIALDPTLKSSVSDTLLLSASDYRSPSDSQMLQAIQSHSSDPGLSLLLGIFYIALAKNSLDSLFFRYFMTDRPKRPVGEEANNYEEDRNRDTFCTQDDIKKGIEDEFGVVYSRDGRRLLKCKNYKLKEYKIKLGTEIICDKAFAWCKLLQEIIIPNSVNSIGDLAFSSCELLQEINLPGSVKALGINPFSRCYKLKLEVAQDSTYKVVSNLVIDTDGRLISCLSNAAKLVIPEEVTSIGDKAFEWCEALRCVTIPMSLGKIGNYAFESCYSLESLNIPESVTQIGVNPFLHCNKLKIDLNQNSIFKIISDLLIDKNGRLIACLNHNSSILIPEEVRSIGDSAFSWNSSLNSISIPTSVTHIGAKAFYECQALQRVDITDFVAVIGAQAFAYCKALKNIILPKTVTHIPNGVFLCCESLENIIIPNSVTSIGDSAFSSCKSLNKVTIPDSVTAIGDSAFSWCVLLQEINIPASVQLLGVNPFSGCKNLRLNMPQHLNFSLINDLLIDAKGCLISCLNDSRYLYIPDMVTSIGDRAFAGKEDLLYLGIPNSVTHIGNEAFHSCRALGRVYIPDSVTFIGDGAFSMCKSLRQVALPESVTYVRDETFRSCDSLEKITIPNRVTSIGAYAFAYCKSLRNVIIPQSLTSIGDHAFLDCHLLRHLELPKPIKYLGINAFPNTCEIKYNSLS